MKNLSIKAVSKLTLVALFAIGLSSCASSGNLDEIKAAFPPEEAALVETIYTEIRQGAR